MLQSGKAASSLHHGHKGRVSEGRGCWAASALDCPQKLKVHLNFNVYQLCWRRVGSRSAVRIFSWQACRGGDWWPETCQTSNLHWGTWENPLQQILVASCLLNQNQNGMSSQPRGEVGSEARRFVLYSTNTISSTMRQHYLTKLGSTILLLYCSSPSLGFKLSTVQVFLLFLASRGKQRIVYNVCLIAYRINLSPVCCNSCNCWKILAALNQMILIGLRFLSLNLRGLWAFYCSAMCNAAKPRIG